MPQKCALCGGPIYDPDQVKRIAEAASAALRRIAYPARADIFKDPTERHAAAEQCREALYDLVPLLDSEIG